MLMMMAQAAVQVVVRRAKHRLTQAILSLHHPVVVAVVAQAAATMVAQAAAMAVAVQATAQAAAQAVVITRVQAVAPAVVVIKMPQKI
jgi:hypothetical protein